MAKRLGNGEHKPSHEEIAQRARAIYEQSGCAPGRDLDNWLQAEAQLRATQRPASAETRQVALKEVAKPSMRQ